MLGTWENLGLLPLVVLELKSWYLVLASTRTVLGAADSIRGAAAAAVFAKVDNPSHTLFHTSPAHLRVVIF